MMFWGIFQLAWQSHDRSGAVIIAGLASILGVVNFFLHRRRAGLGYIEQLASCAAISLVALNLRYDIWFASDYGISVAELHDRMPTWIVPVLTLVLMLWSVLLLSITKPKASGIASAR
jgi:hypothetical protein